MLNRREFTGFLGGCLLATWTIGGSAKAALGEQQGSLQFASASEDLAGNHFIIVTDQQGNDVLKYPLASRAHQVLKHPTLPLLFVVARRPGQYLLVLDLEKKSLQAEIAPAKGRDFCGHAQVSPDGKFLLTTENEHESSQGVVVFRSIQSSFKVVREFPSGGIGPHEFKYSHSGQLLVVANGGIHTKDRIKLNLDNMKSNLSYINANTGEIVDTLTFDESLAQLSIRHIDINAREDVLIAMQFQGERTEQVPLVAVHNRQTGVYFLDIPIAAYYSLKHYCGSACFDSTGTFAAISAPKGDQVLFWNILNKKWLAPQRIKDGCGLANEEAESVFTVSSGRGKMYRVTASTGEKKKIADNPEIKWDNHLSRV